MREVTLEIAKLGLNVGDVVKLKLIDSVGNACMSSSGYSLDITTTLLSANFSIELLENKYINKITSYQIILPSGIKFNFTVPYSLQNAPHDMLSLLQLGCYEGIIDRANKSLDENFIQKLELHFMGKNPRFTKTELDVVRLYEYYANEVIDTTSTIDIMQMMDAYLATITGEE